MDEGAAGQRRQGLTGVAFLRALEKPDPEGMPGTDPKAGALTHPRPEQCPQQWGPYFFRLGAGSTFGAAFNAAANCPGV